MATINKSPASAIPTTVSLSVSNDDWLRLEGDGKKFEFPRPKDFFEFARKYHNIESWQTEEVSLEISHSGIEREVARWEAKTGDHYGRREGGVFCILKLNVDWRKTFFVPSSCPTIFISESEAKKLGNLESKTKQVLDQLERHPKMVSLAKTLSQMKADATKAEADAKEERERINAEIRDSKARAKIEKEERDRQFDYANILSTYDKFYNFTRYETSRDDLVVSLGINKIDLFSFRLYFVKNSSNELNMYARFLYIGSDWRFIRKLTLFSGGKRLEIVYPHDDVYTNVEEDGTVKELGTTKIDPETLKEFILADKIECRVSSEKLYTDIQFNTNMTMAFKEVLGYYFKMASEETNSGKVESN